MAGLVLSDSRRGRRDQDEDEDQRLEKQRESCTHGRSHLDAADTVRCVLRYTALRTTSQAPAREAGSVWGRIGTPCQASRALDAAREEMPMSKHDFRAFSIATSIAVALLCAAIAPAQAARPEGTLTVAVATFGNERWLPHLYVGAEDVVLKPLWENLLSRDGKGNLIPMLAEKWEVLDGGRTWRFHLRK